MESIEALLTCDVRNSLEQIISLSFPSCYCKSGIILFTSYIKYYVEDKCAVKANSMTKPPNRNTGNDIEILSFIQSFFFFFSFCNDIWNNDYKMSCSLSWHFCIKGLKGIVRLFLFQVFLEGFDGQITNVHLKYYKIQKLWILHLWLHQTPQYTIWRRVRTLSRCVIFLTSEQYCKMLSWKIRLLFNQDCTEHSYRFPRTPSSIFCLPGNKNNFLYFHF